MKIIRDIYTKCDIEKPVIALGNFDGIHLGHQALIKETVRRAKQIDGTPVLFTFYPHPIKVIRNVDEPFLIQTFKEKAKIIKNLGIEILICARFTKEFASLDPEFFIKNILVDNLNVKVICVGHDYTFGKNGVGTVKNLKEYAVKYSFEVVVIPPVKVDGVVVSSTKIREFLKNGLISKANMFLGRPYTISGIVKEGDKRGVALGFPTANIYPQNEILLPNGVYAAYAYIDSKRFKAAVNVGTNPTFKGKIKHIEVHLLNFSGNIYNKKIRVEFIEYIREERAFKSADALVKQIKKDINKIKQIL